MYMILVSFSIRKSIDHDFQCSCCKKLQFCVNTKRHTVDVENANLIFLDAFLLSVYECFGLYILSGSLCLFVLVKTPVKYVGSFAEYMIFVR